MESNGPSYPANETSAGSNSNEEVKGASALANRKSFSQATKIVAVTPLWGALPKSKAGWAQVSFASGLIARREFRGAVVLIVLSLLVTVLEGALGAPKWVMVLTLPIFVGLVQFQACSSLSNASLSQWAAMGANGRVTDGNRLSTSAVGSWSWLVGLLMSAAAFIGMLVAVSVVLVHILGGETYSSWDGPGVWALVMMAPLVIVILAGLAEVPQLVKTKRESSERGAENEKPGQG